ncbi:hypothetical protein GW796_08905 [archaeon]|nr:hypothetical protein [archaeon]NCQ51997.1 hypothetical protein [archaeon]
MSKKVISPSEFEKRVEIEFCYLVYTECMKRDFAWSKARKTIGEEFTVE